MFAVRLANPKSITIPGPRAEFRPGALCLLRSLCEPDKHTRHQHRGGDDSGDEKRVRIEVLPVLESPITSSLSSTSYDCSEVRGGLAPHARGAATGLPWGIQGRASVT